jgi:hypothetical protein
VPAICPECGGSGKVHLAQYDRTKIPPHERNNDKWVKAQTVAAPNAVTCRVCWGSGTL